MKILLVDPPGKNKGFNTGLAYISAILKKRYEVSVLDLNNIEAGLCGEPNPDMPIDEMETRIISAVNGYDPNVLGVSVKTFTAEISKITTTGLRTGILGIIRCHLGKRHLV